MFSKERGITLIEVIVVMVIVTMFSMILIADFPKILRQFAISRASYKLSQDIRRTEDLGLSGVQIGQNVKAQGYGVYIDVADDKKYIIYADRGPLDLQGHSLANQQYDTTTQYCDQITDLDPNLDCIVESVDISKQESGIYIKEINGGNGIWASLNFKPPNPDILLKTSATSGSAGENSIEIKLGSSADDSLERIISVNKSGLIEVK